MNEEYRCWLEFLKLRMALYIDKGAELPCSKMSSQIVQIWVVNSMGVDLTPIVMTIV
jgi:hypothetical protein